MEGIKEKEPNRSIGEDKYKEVYNEMLLDHLSLGYSFDSFTDANVCLSTLYNWVDKYPKFKEAKVIGTAKGLKFYETLLRHKLTGIDGQKIKAKSIDTTCLIFTMKTRFHKTYGEKAKVETEHSISEETKKLIIDMGD